VLELIVLTEWFEAKTTGEDPATMIPNTSFAFYAICLTQYARARMLRQALSAVTDPSLTKITNGSHHGHSSGIGTCMFDHAVALSHALLFPTLGAHWQSLNAPTEVAKGSVLLPPFALVALHCEVARPVWDLIGDHLFEMVKVILPYATCQCEVHAVQQFLSLTYLLFSLSDCSTWYSGTFQLC